MNQATEPEYQVTLSTMVTVGELVDFIAGSIHDHDVLLDFMVQLDEAVADYDFTVRLHRRISEAIASEDVA